MLKYFVLTFLAFSTLVCTSRFAHAEEFDLGVEKDMASADSESALAAEEEASRRAQDEKVRAQQEKEIAHRETVKARHEETVAKMKIAKWNEDEKRLTLEKNEAAKRKEIAQAKMQKLAAEVSAREAELQALTEVVDQTVAERDRYETAIEKTNDRINQIEVKMKQQSLRRSQAEADKLKLAKHLQERRSYLHSIVRSPAANGAQVQRQKTRAPAKTQPTAKTGSNVSAQ
jgi:chromosome segregation ATPase